MKKLGIGLLIMAILVLMYFILVALNIIPTYQCGSTMGINGTVNWCQWSRGIIVG